MVNVFSIIQCIFIAVYLILFRLCKASLREFIRKTDGNSIVVRSLMQLTFYSDIWLGLVDQIDSPVAHSTNGFPP